MVLRTIFVQIGKVHLSLILALMAVFVVPAGAQQIETTPPPAGSPKAQPYLPGDRLDYHLLLPLPPAQGSIRDVTDKDIDVELQKAVDPARWQTAEQDAEYVYPRFSDALGRPLDRADLPRTVHLINRALRDVEGPAFAAKDAFHRPRPFQRFQLVRVCGKAAAPHPEINPTTGSSYPSGHSTYGWTTALILAQVAPERAPQILQRAAEYAESRLVCGMHFPSDIEAGRVLAVAVVEHLKSSPAFRQDLACARVEFQAASGKAKIPDSCPVPN
jgi:acid phosphatase (class A)